MKGSRFFRMFSLGSVWVWLALFAIVPNVALFLVSFLDRGEQTYFIPVMTLGNYARLLEPGFISILLHSLYLALMSTFFCLLIGYPFAYLMARARKSLRPWLLLLVIIPFWTNSLVRTYALIIILKKQGVLNTLLNTLGLVEGKVSFMYDDIAVFVGLTYTMLPFMILPLYASIEKLDVRLLDAAKDLGAGSLRTFIHVTLPLTIGGIAAGCVLVFLPCLGCFYVPELLGGAKSMLLGSYIKNQFLTARDWPLGAAASTTLTLLLIVMALIYKLFAKKTPDPTPRPKKNRYRLPGGVVR